jgi:hypothetical protein
LAATEVARAASSPVMRLHVSSMTLPLGVLGAASGRELWEPRVKEACLAGWGGGGGGGGERGEKGREANRPAYVEEATRHQPEARTQPSTEQPQWDSQAPRGTYFKLPMC